MKRLLAPSVKTGPWRLTGPGFHHLIRVLRAMPGETIELFNGAGHAFTATVHSVADSWADLEVGDARPQPLPRPLHVIQGLPKADKLELVLQKGTELGVTAFWPAATQRAVVKLQPPFNVKLQRWQRIVDEAARQCGRSDVPQVHAPCALTEALQALPQGSKPLILDEAERSRTLAQAFAMVPPDAGVAVVVGPEGGLTRQEVEACCAAGAVAVTLGSSVLRTETAALAAATVLRHLDGWLG
jgi:16S rRNA (uracil1498-N3)-methyltransferase